MFPAPFHGMNGWNKATDMLTMGASVDPLYIRIHEHDNVGIVVNAEGVSRGARFPDGVTAGEAIPQSHKVALRDLEAGEPVMRYGFVIGYAVRPIARGSWVREELLEMPAAPPLDELPLATATTIDPFWRRAS